MPRTKTPFKTLSLALLTALSGPALAATITVSSSADSGPGSLRDAVSSAMDGDRIAFDASLDGGTILLTSPVTVDKDLRITGNGSTNTHLSGGMSSRIFSIMDAEVLLADLKLKDGYHAMRGGAIMASNSMLRIDDVRIDGNEAAGPNADDGGGGIYLDNSQLELINGVWFSSNSASGASGSGGAIFVGTMSSVAGNGARFTGNSASRAGGGIEDNSGSTTWVSLKLTSFDGNTTGAAPGNGGAIHITGDGNLRITDSELINNSAAREGGALWNGAGTMLVRNCMINTNVAMGDALDDGGGALFNNGGALFVDNSEINNNQATGTSGSGGGLLNFLGSASVRNTSFTGNSASRAGGGIEDQSGASSAFLLENVDLIGNTTGAMPGNGGGLHISGDGDATISGGSVIGNTAASEGGGLWNSVGKMLVTGTLVQDNVANGDAADNGGGGLFNNGGTLTVQDAEIRNNQAAGMSGSGGGLLNFMGSAAIRNSIFSGNSASRAGGGIEDQSGAATMFRMDDVQLLGNATGPMPGNGGGLHITGDGSIAINGGTVKDNTATSEGGGLWNSLGTMTVRGTLIQDNVASGAAADNGGGGLFNNGGTVIVKDGALFIGNVADGASGSGGALFNEMGGTMRLLGVEVNNNHSMRAGGGLEDNSGAGTKVVVRGSMFDGNTTGAAPGNGGAIHITGAGDMDVMQSRFTNNSASREGGALWNGSGIMRVVQCSIDGNTASGASTDDGGGGLFNNGGILDIDRSTVSNNTADGSAGQGGGIHSNPAGELKVGFSTISGNTAMADGGGVFVAGTGRVSNSTIAANMASGNGGGIALGSSASYTLNGSLVADNSASGTDQDLAGMAFASDGYNLIGQDNSGNFPVTFGDQEGSTASPIDPELDPLADNGGPTMTHALRCASSAINAGDPTDLRLDQRGQAVFLLLRDIGSFEKQSPCLGGVLREADRTVAIQPNPARNTTTVTLPQADGQVQLLDMNGRSLQVWNGVGTSLSVDVSSLASGIYFIEWTSTEGSAAPQVHKLIVE